MKPRSKSVLNVLGPGLIAGAADDDPSGVGTYSVAGAQLGFTMLWTAWVTWPLMAAVQMMCARIGMVTGRGLAATLRRKIWRPVLILFSFALLIANTLNIGADLSAMADAANMLSGVNSRFWVVAFALVISWATIKLKYGQIAHTLKWLTIFLFAYVITAFIVCDDWRAVVSSSIIPTWPHSSSEWSVLVAILGTTISPYLFYWQSSQEVEEEKAHGQKTLAQRKNATAIEIRDRKIDVGVGTLFSNLVMFFIILTTALTLHKNGVTTIETSAQAAEALRPLAGKFASTVYTLGLLGVGFLAIPTLTGSAAYALAETFGWRQGLDENLRKARAFYGVIALSTLLGVALNFSNFNPVKALYWSAVVNGVLAPFLLVGVLLVASDDKIMCGQRSSILGRSVVAFATFVMFFCAAAMFF